MARYSYGDDLISQKVNGQSNFYLYDGLGSTKALTNGNGLITDTYQYDGYGNVTAKTGSTDNNYLYAGEQFDRSLNQYYLRARYYNPGVGRFTQMDSWQGRANSPITLNKYLYADANPVMNIDPTGNYTSEFGYAVEEEVIRQYKLAYPECAFNAIPVNKKKSVGRLCTFGRSMRYGDLTGYWKPDILNFIDKSFNEIKPLSIDGIYKV